MLWWLQFFLFSHRFVYENRIRTHDLSEVQSLRRSSARLLSDSSDHLTAKRHWVPVHLRPVRDFSTLLGSFCCLFSGGLKWWHFLSFELEITAFLEFARSLHNPTSSKAVASPNDQCDGHGEHGEQHHLGTSGWTKNSSQKLKGSVPDEADVWILQGRQICQSQVACNLRSLGGSPFQAMKKSFRVQKFRTWGCKLVRYIQIRFVHPLGLTLTHQKMSLKPLSSYCRNENTHSQSYNSTPQCHQSFVGKLIHSFWRLWWGLHKWRRVLLWFKTLVANIVNDCASSSSLGLQTSMCSYVSTWSIAQNRIYIREDQVLQFDGDWKFVKRF